MEPFRETSLSLGLPVDVGIIPDVVIRRCYKKSVRTTGEKHKWPLLMQHLEVLVCKDIYGNKNKVYKLMQTCILSLHIHIFSELKEVTEVTSILCRVLLLSVQESKLRWGKTSKGGGLNGSLQMNPTGGFQSKNSSLYWLMRSMLCQFFQAPNKQI